jgi:hypothetical protein
MSIEERQTGDLDENMFDVLRDFYQSNREVRTLPLGVPPKAEIEVEETTLVNRFKPLEERPKQEEFVVVGKAPEIITGLDESDIPAVLPVNFVGSPHWVPV